MRSGRKTCPRLTWWERCCFLSLWVSHSAELLTGNPEQQRCCNLGARQSSMPLTSMAPAILQQKTTFLLIIEHCYFFQWDPGATHKGVIPVGWCVTKLRFSVVPLNIRHPWLKSFKVPEAEQSLLLGAPDWLRLWFWYSSTRSFHENHISASLIHAEFRNAMHTTITIFNISFYVRNSYIMRF